MAMKIAKQALRSGDWPEGLVSIVQQKYSSVMDNAISHYLEIKEHKKLMLMVKGWVDFTQRLSQSNQQTIVEMREGEELLANQLQDINTRLELLSYITGEMLAHKNTLPVDSLLSSVRVFGS